MGPHRRFPDPDAALRDRISRHAARLAFDGGRIDDAVAELRELAHGRNDVLVEAGGVAVGAWITRRDLPHDLIAAALILAATELPDKAELGRWISVGQRRASMRRR